MFYDIKNNELSDINGGSKAGLIVTGMISLAGGAVACCIPGGQAGGVFGIYSGAVSLAAGLVY